MKKKIILVIHTHYTNSILFLNIILWEKKSPVSNSEKDHLFEIKNTQLFEIKKVELFKIKKKHSSILNWKC